MGVTWRGREHKEFIANHLSLYSQHATDGTLKLFWPDFFNKWFDKWPLPEPAPDAVVKAGSLQEAIKADRVKKIKQVKRALKGAADDNATGGRKNLRLEDNLPRRRAEVQVYMALYYDTRIRSTVVERWHKSGITNMNFTGLDIPEDQIDPEDSALLRDNKIPLSYKNQIAQELYDAEEEEIKQAVRSKRDAELLIQTVYSVNEEERLELVQAYQKNISSLGKNMMVVLRNTERKCAAKGIVWLACPTASVGGKPVGHFQCVGETPDGEDFETFIGAEKAKEIKQLFSNWIHKIYPMSDWPLFTLPAPAMAAEPSDTSNGLTNATSNGLTNATSNGLTNATSNGLIDAMPDGFIDATSNGLIDAIPDGPIDARSDGPIDVMPNGPIDVMPNGPIDAMPNGPIDAASLVPELSTPSSQLGGSFDQSAAVDGLSGAAQFASEMLPQPEGLYPLVTPNTFAGIDFSPDPSPRIQHSAHLPLPQANDPQATTPQLNSQPNTLLPDPLLGSEIASQTSVGPLPGLLTGITNEPTWMKKKQTLDYFRSTFKLGQLSDVIQHWYELERLLGFQEATSANFPTDKRPPVVPIFHKNAHNYKKDYGVEVYTLGRQIKGWWTEICPPSGAPRVQFGGPTGIYTIVVLLSWWCTLLRPKPAREHTECLRMLEDVNRVLVTTINNLKNHPTASTPLPSSQSRKRAGSGGLHPKKRKRTGRA